MAPPFPGCPSAATRCVGLASACDWGMGSPDERRPSPVSSTHYRVQIRRQSALGQTILRPGFRRACKPGENAAPTASSNRGGRCQDLSAGRLPADPASGYAPACADWHSSGSVTAGGPHPAVTPLATAAGRKPSPGSRFRRAPERSERSLKMIGALAEHERRWRNEFERFLQGVDFGEVPWAKDLHTGVPHEEIVAGAEEHKADLLVIGSTGRTGLARELRAMSQDRSRRQVTVRPIPPLWRSPPRLDPGPLGPYCR